MGGRQNFKHRSPSRNGGFQLPLPESGQLTWTVREEVFCFSPQDLYRMLSPSCLIEDGGEGKGENRVSQGLETLDLKRKMRIQYFREGLAGSTAPPSGRWPWSDASKTGGRIYSLPDVHCTHHYTRQHPLSWEALVPSLCYR